MDLHESGPWPYPWLTDEGQWAPLNIVCIVRGEDNTSTMPRWKRVFVCIFLWFVCVPMCSPRPYTIYIYFIRPWHGIAYCAETVVKHLQTNQTEHVLFPVHCRESIWSSQSAVKLSGRKLTLFPRCPVAGVDDLVSLPRELKPPPPPPLPPSPHSQPGLRFKPHLSNSFLATLQSPECFEWRYKILRQSLIESGVSLSMQC